MRPNDPPASSNLELFRSRLENIIDARHPLVRLARLIDRQRFAEALGPLDQEAGRPGPPTRLMVGLHVVKHLDGLSDEAVCARCLDSPYVQAFCGEEFFRHELPLDRSAMTRWRQRIRAGKLEELLAETPAAARRAGAVGSPGPRSSGPAWTAATVATTSRTGPARSPHAKSAGSRRPSARSGAGGTGSSR